MSESPQTGRFESESDAYDQGRPVGLATGALALSFVAFLNLLGLDTDEGFVDSGAEADAADWVRLNRAIDALSDHHREILRLRYFADLSYRELAEALDIPVGTVMSRLHLARQALGNEFTKERS
jgi:RNA polymerase sigma factor (sigma-70 family)